MKKLIIIAAGLAVAGLGLTIYTKKVKPIIRKRKEEDKTVIEYFNKGSKILSKLTLEIEKEGPLNAPEIDKLLSEYSDWTFNRPDEIKNNKLYSEMMDNFDDIKDLSLSKLCKDLFE